MVQNQQSSPRGTLASVHLVFLHLAEEEQRAAGPGRERESVVTKVRGERIRNRVDGEVGCGLMGPNCVGWRRPGHVNAGRFWKR